MTNLETEPARKGVDKLEQTSDDPEVLQVTGVTHRVTRTILLPT